MKWLDFSEAERKCEGLARGIKRSWFERFWGGENCLLDWISYGKLVLNVHCKFWCWGWNSNTLATWCEELTTWKRPRCWERLKVGGEGDNRGWDGWMALLTWWTWVWASSGRWWWTGKPGELQSMELQRVRHDWATEQNWLDWKLLIHMSRDRGDRKGCWGLVLKNGSSGIGKLVKKKIQLCTVSYKPNKNSTGDTS